MIGVADAYPSRSSFLRLLHCNVVGLGSDYEAEPVVAVHCGCAWALSDDFELWLWVYATKLQHVEVAMEASNTVRVYAS